MSDLINFYMPIGKVEKQDDGSRIVSGYASTPTKDLDGEIVSIDAIKNALPGYMEWKNVRQMHQPLAVGRAQEATVDSDGLYLTAKIVDPACVKLIDEKVLQGFSIGGRKLAKKGDTITDLELIEISVVDRPANQDCRIEIVKGAKPVDGFAVLGVGLAVSADDLVIPSEHVGPLRKFFSALFGKAGDAPGDGEKPYGDVAYADPGYQPDGKKRYPIDTEAHIRAAWNYISKPKNAAKYKDGDAAKIKAKIVAAWKAKIDKDGPPSASEKAVSPTLAKLIDTSVFDAGDALSALRIIMQVLEWELGEEEDEPEQVGDLQEAIARLKSFIAAEIQESPSKEGVTEAEKTATADEDSALSNLRKELKMADNSVEKRFGAANKASLMKAKHHLGKAVACHGMAMKCMNKAAAACGAMKAANKAVALADIMKSDGVAGHLAAAAGHMETMADHHELAMSHMGKAASGFAGEGGGAGVLDEDNVGGEASEIGQGELTEGGVPEYEADQPYPGKGARGGFTKTQVDHLIAAAVKAANAETENTLLKQQLEFMKSQPGPNKSRAFAFDASGSPFFGKGANGDDPRALLLEGVSVDLADPNSREAASRKMLANMFAAPQVFGKSVMSPEFKGRPVKQVN